MPSAGAPPADRSDRRGSPAADRITSAGIRYSNIEPDQEISADPGPWASSRGRAETSARRDVALGDRDEARRGTPRRRADRSSRSRADCRSSGSRSRRAGGSDRRGSGSPSPRRAGERDRSSRESRPIREALAVATRSSPRSATFDGVAPSPDRRFSRSGSQRASARSEHAPDHRRGTSPRNRGGGWRRRRESSPPRRVRRDRPPVPRRGGTRDVQDGLCARRGASRATRRTPRGLAEHSTSAAAKASSASSSCFRVTSPERRRSPSAIAPARISSTRPALRRASPDRAPGGDCLSARVRERDQVPGEIAAVHGGHVSAARARGARGCRTSCRNGRGSGRGFASYRASLRDARRSPRCRANRSRERQRSTADTCRDSSARYGARLSLRAPPGSCRAAGNGLRRPTKVSKKRHVRRAMRRNVRRSAAAKGVARESGRARSPHARSPERKAQSRMNGAANGPCRRVRKSHDDGAPAATSSALPVRGEERPRSRRPEPERARAAVTHSRR